MKSMIILKNAARVVTLLIPVLFVSPMLNADPTDDIYGSWEMMNINQSGANYQIVMTVEPDTVRMTSRCSHNGNQVEAIVSSAAIITGDQLQITATDSDEKEHSPGYLSCRASIKPMHLNYAFEEGDLVLSDPKQTKPMVLKRLTE